MDLKKKLAMGIVTGAMAVSLIGGGTYAYFNDVETSNNTFAAGTLDLAVSPTTIIDVDNLKPGDTMVRTFNLENNGSLDIAEVLLSTDYSVKNSGVRNTEDLGKHIRVNIMYNADKPNDPINWITLYDLKNMTPKLVADKYLGRGENSGLTSGDSDKLRVKFEFVDNGEDQNQFQGDSVKLTWTFDAQQTAGEEK